MKLESYEFVSVEPVREIPPTYEGDPLARKAFHRVNVRVSEAGERSGSVTCVLQIELVHDPEANIEVLQQSVRKQIPSILRKFAEGIENGAPEDGSTYYALHDDND